MSRLHLKTEASLGLLAADLVVLWLALPAAYDDTAPTWLRTTLGAVALLALALALWSILMIVRDLRARGAR
ncbi:hypothetical protein [Nocardioides plantarum]|uniref:Uncharacterized protein n=1 Tax=Nocardioides plantarum TaxID=29299 RepID=A0ABV5K9S4_9ACTN|nr:hypothetical protein [Nocardioides plantarum]